MTPIYRSARGFMALALVMLVATVGRAEPFRLAVAGKPSTPIVIAESAGIAVKGHAAKLAEMLGKITGGKFEVVNGDGIQGIAVGRAADFPKLGLADQFRPDDLQRREEYRLKSHAGGLRVVGATDLAVQHAVWDVLHRIGYRQYFPGEAWEVIPKAPDVTVNVDVFEKPSYHSRRIWYGFGAWDYAKVPYQDWCAKNRCLAGIDLHTGHAYDGMVKDLKKEFDDHPEYWPLLNGERKPVRNPKPCLSNPEVRRLIVDRCIKQIQKNPMTDSVSVDPSDGGGWCECPQCAKMGSVSDQAITLANEVAEAIQKKYPGKLVGIYAYNYHSSPPSVAVHPKVVVSVATAFIKGGNSLQEIMSGWAERKAVLGVREYYSVNTWDRDQPAHARGGNIDYLKRTIPEFYAKGARFMSAESSDNWGPNGLGYYLSARMLWNIAEAERVDGLITDFLDRCFGKAREPMREFYQQLDGSKPHLVTGDQLGRMFRALEKARPLADTPEAHRRLDELTLYARYATLYHRYETADAKTRQQAFENLIRHAYRMRKTMLVHTLALYRDLAGRDKTVSVPPDAMWNKPEGKNPWKSSEAFSPGELSDFVSDGVKSHQLVKLDFEPVRYGSELVMAAERLAFPKGLPIGDLGPGRQVQTFQTMVEKAPSTIELAITGGLIAHYRDRGNVKVEVIKIGGASATGEKETVVATDRSVPPDGKERTVKIELKETGTYLVKVSDGGDRTAVRWVGELPWVIPSTQELPMNNFYGQWMGYFYVPRGTKTIGIFGGEHGEVRDSRDRPQFWLNGREKNFYGVPVPEGQDGKVWKIRYARGAVRLLNVPPYFALKPEHLLVPKEVVEKELRP